MDSGAFPVRPPLLYERERVDGVSVGCVWGCGAMADVGDHEQTDRIARLRADLFHHCFVVVGIARRRDRAVAPAANEEQLPTATNEAREVRIDVDNLVLGRIGDRRILVEVHWPLRRMPVRILEHEIAKEISAEGNG